MGLCRMLVDVMRVHDTKEGEMFQLFTRPEGSQTKERKQKCPLQLQKVVPQRGETPEQTKERAWEVMKGAAEGYCKGDDLCTIKTMLKTIAPDKKVVKEAPEEKNWGWAGHGFANRKGGERG